MAALGSDAAAVVSMPAGSGTSATSNRRLSALVQGVERLVASGVHALGHVSLGYATRPPGDVITEINGWAVVPVVGVFLDHAPAGPYQIGPVAHAVRAARRAGLREVVLNPGVTVDPLYRLLDATICTFEGSWTDYQAWSAEDAAAGDGHLVFGVPPHESGVARTLAATRRAGLLLITDRPSAYSDSPAETTESQTTFAAAT